MTDTAVSATDKPAIRFGWFAYAAALVLIAPVLIVDVVPTQDGPVHLAQSAMIAWFGWGGALPEPIATFYQWNPQIEPNYSVYAILAGLIRIFGDPLVAHTAYLGVYGALFAAAAAMAVKCETDRRLLPYLLLLPIAFGLFIHFGFYNYALGFPAFLAFAALWRRIGARRNLATFLVLAAALFLLGLTHLSTVVAACLLLAAGGLSRAVAALAGGDRRAVAWQLAKDGAWSAAIAAPALALIAAFLIAYPSATTDAANLRYSIRSVVRRLVTFEYFFAFTWWEVLALAPVIAAMIVLVLAALKRWRSGDLVWPIFVVLICIVSALDLKTAQGVPLAERLAAFTWIGVALAIASRRAGRERYACALRRCGVLAGGAKRRARRRLYGMGGYDACRARRRPAARARDFYGGRPRRPRQRGLFVARTAGRTHPTSRRRDGARRRSRLDTAVDAVLRLLPAALRAARGFSVRRARVGRSSRKPSR